MQPVSATKKERLGGELQGDAQGVEAGGRWVGGTCRRRPGPGLSHVLRALVTQAVSQDSAPPAGSAWGQSGAQMGAEGGWQQEGCCVKSFQN